MPPAGEKFRRRRSRSGTLPQPVEPVSASETGFSVAASLRNGAIPDAAARRCLGGVVSRAHMRARARVSDFSTSWKNF